MKIRLYLSFLLLQIFLNGISQPVEIIYQGNVIQTSYADNETYGPFNIGFTFTYFGTAFTQFHVSSNGLISFGAGTTDAGEDPIPATGAPNNIIAPFWDNLVVDGSGNILYRTIGASGNKMLIVQFKNMGFYNGPAYMGTFSVVLYEGTNKIQFQYRSIILPSSATAHGQSATIGLENADGSAGVQYAYHNPSAISPLQAILFTPSGSTYTMDPVATYEPVYLTPNLTLPEPGIPVLINPALGAVIGTEHTFSWNATPNTENYSLRISTNPNLSGAAMYDAGTSTNSYVTGLTPGTTYYWGVFASNASGTTWCEVRSFTVSATPPLVAVPATYWTEQSHDTTMVLNYSGGDASTKTAIITTLPLQGQLFQYIAGVKGPQITSTPANVTDPGMKVIYSSPSASGNGIGNFNFKMHDGTGDSPEATITVNVSPDGIPHVLYVAKGTGVEIQFDREMSNPSGKHGQFTVKVNGSPVELTSAAIKEGDPFTIVLAPATPLTGSETVSISYTQGDVTSSAGGFLISFTNEPVTLRSQTILFTQGLTKQFHLSPLTLTASSDSGLGLSYSSSNLGIATIATNLVTFRSVGTCKIIARQAGNTTYAPAKFERSLMLTKGDQTITFATLPGKATDDPDFNPGATASSGLPVSYSSSNPAVAIIAGSLIHITGAGTTIITASQPGNSNYYAATEVPQTLEVTLATGIDDPIISNNSFKIYRSYNRICIETLNDDWDGRKGSVRVIGLNGNRVSDIQNVVFETGSPVQVEAPAETGFFIIEIRSGQKRITGKIVL